MLDSSDRFFHSHSNFGDAHTVINVGGEPFHAVAVALIDYLQRSTLLNELLLKKILTAYYRYFPQVISSDPHFSTVKERMIFLLKNTRMAELVERMSYVLRQLAVDSLYINYLDLEYRDVFMNLEKTMDSNYLRDPQVRLPKSALTALSKALDLPITLSFKDQGKELRRCENTLDSSKTALVIQVQNEKYYPRVQHPNAFTLVGKLNVVNQSAKEINNQDEHILKDILDVIKVDNQRLLQTYLQQRQKILCMVSAGELSYSQLVKWYCLLLPETNDFIIHLEPLSYPVVDTPVCIQQDKITLLASAFASSMTMGKFCADQFFDNIENNPHWSNVNVF